MARFGRPSAHLASCAALLCLAGCRSLAHPLGRAEGPVPPAGAPPGLRFADVPVTADGGPVLHVATRTTSKWIPEIMGPGVAVVDVNRDGAPDVLLANSGAVGARERPAGAANRLLLNDGHGGLRDATAAWRVPSIGYGMGVATGDVDGDGWPDVVLTTYGPGLRLLRSTGTAFEDISAASGLPDDVGWAASAGFLDVERDGDLDLFVTRYLAYDPAAIVPCFEGGQPVYCTPMHYEGQHDLLFVNDGHGVFRDASSEAGIDGAARNGLALSLVDVEGDGDVDAYVANDIDPNQLWLNDGHGHFQDAGPRSGTALSPAGQVEASMGVDAGDSNDDGRVDLAVANFQGEALELWLQRGGLLFDERSDAAGIGRVGRERMKWGTAFLDADNDGDEDLAVAAGHIYDNAAEVRPGLTFAQPNLLFENLGDGTFRGVGALAGPPFSQPFVNRGLAVGELDGDGAVDVVFGRNGGPLGVGRNVGTARGGFVNLWLEGAGGNTPGIGARVTASVGGRTLHRRVTGASSYLSASDRRVHLGLGAAAQADDVRVVWPDGTAQDLGTLPGNAYYHVRQGDAPVAYVPGQSVLRP